ncbi:MAG: bifunctional adenosylcobinamide kinase/adenosylcobinamide-phosphate guanylyltransferase [Clostridia bacterium]|nr:bifunctional adenosylcobinamide kinase/adenosylcobinamide-phosphate guanylyltransferase [Clostridia bacterium]
MVLIFGGKYQGKVEYALKEFGLKEEDVCYVKEDIDYSKKVIAGLENFVWQCVLKNIEAKDCLGDLEDKIVIIEDVTAGLVPMDKDEREYREMVGRTMYYLGKKADRVIRVFCGLGGDLK